MLTRRETVRIFNPASEEAAAGLIVRPPLDAFGPLDFNAIDSIITAGYEATRAALEQFRSPSAAEAGTSTGRGAGDAGGR